MKSSVSVAGVLAALAWGCGGDTTEGTPTTDGGVAPDATTNVCDGSACSDAGADGGTGGGTDAGTDASADAGAVHFVLVTPDVVPLGETSVQVTWAAPAGAPVAWYDVRASSDPASTPVPTTLTHLPAGTTRATLSGLKPGTLGRVVVAAAVGDAPAADAPTAPMWTPYGAINEDSVSSVTPLAGYPGAPYAEGIFVSSTFSMFFAHAYVKEASFVFAGRARVADRAPHLQLREPRRSVSERLRLPRRHGRHADLERRRLEGPVANSTRTASSSTITFR